MRVGMRGMWQEVQEDVTQETASSEGEQDVEQPADGWVEHVVTCLRAGVAFRLRQKPQQ